MLLIYANKCSNQARDSILQHAFIVFESFDAYPSFSQTHMYLFPSSCITRIPVLYMISHTADASPGF